MHPQIQAKLPSRGSLGISLYSMKTLPRGAELFLVKKEG
jgi:hypothetical protein